MNQSLWTLSAFVRIWRIVLKKSAKLRSRPRGRCRWRRHRLHSSIVADKSPVYWTPERGYLSVPFADDIELSLKFG